MDKLTSSLEACGIEHGDALPACTHTHAPRNLSTPRAGSTYHSIGELILARRRSTQRKHNVVIAQVRKCIGRRTFTQTVGRAGPEQKAFLLGCQFLLRESAKYVLPLYITQPVAIHRFTLPVTPPCGHGLIFEPSSTWAKHGFCCSGWTRNS